MCACCLLTVGQKLLISSFLLIYFSFSPLNLCSALHIVCASQINRTSELARVFGIDFFSVLSRGSQYRVESMLLRLAHTQNYLAIAPGSQQVSAVLCKIPSTNITLCQLRLSYVSFPEQFTTSNLIFCIESSISLVTCLLFVLYVKCMLFEFSVLIVA